MSSKPTSVPRWNTAGHNRVEPAAFEKVEGWENGARPASSTFNWLQGLTGDWCQYLSDGALSGNHTIAGTLGVTSLAVTTGATVGTTLAVTGAATFSSSVAIGGNVTTDIVLATDKHVVLQGDGSIKHGDRQVNVAPRVIATTGAVAWDFSNRWWASTGAGQVSIAVDVQQHERIRSVSVVRAGNSSCNVTMDVIRLDAAGAATVVSSNDVPSATWGPQTAVTPNWTIGGESVVVNVTFSATGGKLRQLLVTYDRP